MKARISIIILIASLTISISFSSGNSENERSYVNSLGMKMVQIKAGSFMMGKEDTELKPESLRYPDPAWHRGKIEEPAMWKGNKQGLIGAFFSNTEPRLSRYQKILQNVDLDWSNKEKPQLNRWRSRSVRLRGYIAGPVSKKVILTIQASGSATVKVDGEKIIDSKNALASASGEVLMAAEKLSEIEIDADDTVYIRLYWQWDSKEKHIVPADALFYDADDYNQTQIFVKWLPGSGEKAAEDYAAIMTRLPDTRLLLVKIFTSAKQR